MSLHPALKAALRTRVALAIIAVTFAGLIFSRYFPQAIIYLGYDQTQAITWRNGYTLYTYPLIHKDLMSWTYMSGSILLPAILLAGSIRERYLVFLVCASVPLGALTFSFLHVDDRQFLIGNVMITWAYAGAILVFGWNQWKSIHTIWKIYVILVALSFLMLAFEKDVAIASAQ